MIILRQRIYADLIDYANPLKTREIIEERRQERKQNGEEPSTAMKVAGIGLTAGALAFAGHRGYLGGHMMKWTNKGLYKAGNLVGSNTLMNKGAQGYLAGSMKTGGMLTGKGAREFYKYGASGIEKEAGEGMKNLSKFADKEKWDNTNLGKALAETNKDLGLGKDGIGKITTSSLGVDSGTRGVSGMNSNFNTNFDITTRSKIGSDGTISVVDAHGKSNNTLGTIKTEGTGDNMKSIWNPTQQPAAQ